MHLRQRLAERRARRSPARRRLARTARAAADRCSRRAASRATAQTPRRRRARRTACSAHRLRVRGRRLHTPAARRSCRACVPASLRSTARNTKSWICRLSRKRTSSFCGCAFTSTSVGIDVEVQHVRGLPPGIQHVAIAEPHGVHEQPVAHRAAVDEPELQVATWRAPPTARRSSRDRRTGPARMLERDARARRTPAPTMRAEPRGARRRSPRSAGASNKVREPLRRRNATSSRDSARRSTQPHDVALLGDFAAQELAPRRQVVEQVAHFDRGAGRMRRRRGLADAAAVDAHAARRAPRRRGAT